MLTRFLCWVKQKKQKIIFVVQKEENKRNKKYGTSRNLKTIRVEINKITNWCLPMVLVGEMALTMVEDIQDNERTKFTKKHHNDQGY